jgi:hypothetical protein
MTASITFLTSGSACSAILPMVRNAEFTDAVALARAVATISAAGSLSFWPARLRLSCTRLIMMFWRSRSAAPWAAVAIFVL